MSQHQGHIIFYDGDCLFCDSFIQKVLTRDRQNMFKATSLTSNHAKSLLQRYAVQPADASTMYVLTDVGTINETLLDRSNAALFCLISMGGGYQLLRVAYWVPRFLRDIAYRMIAKIRHRLLPKSTQCALIGPELRDKYLR